MNGKDQKIAIIMGAGPAGLTAAYELVTRTDIKPVVFEMTDHVGGISKTLNYKGNRIDIGGHRFFSKSDKVMDWWQNIMPLGDPEKLDNIMLKRRRLSRIFHLRKFFDYPISLNLTTLSNLGFLKIIKIGISYLYIRLFPIKHENSLEDFFINRFGKELYETFFKDYTEKVWGTSCDNIKADWGRQRIKGVSVTKVMLHALAKLLPWKRKKVETSLIEEFWYPKYGPGQLWERVSEIIQEKGAEVHMNHEIIEINRKGDYITSVKVRDHDKGEEKVFSGDYFVSSIPIKDLVIYTKDSVPGYVKDIANGLVYRDFITVGVLIKDFKIKAPDNWIYVQESDVKLGRIQIFNNWSPYLVKDLDNTWIGLEYFCTEGDDLWNLGNQDMAALGCKELIKLGFVNKEDILDTTVIKMPKAYPAYFGTYEEINIIKDYTDTIKNLFLVGRNGMHRYNNQDHSMLTAICAVDNIIKNKENKDNIWTINTEEKYHETK